MGAWGFLILSFPPKTQPSPQTTAFTSAYSLGGAKWRSPLPGTPTQTNWNRSLPDMDQAPRRGRGQPPLTALPSPQPRSLSPGARTCQSAARHPAQNGGSWAAAVWPRRVLAPARGDIAPRVPPGPPAGRAAAVPARPCPSTAAGKSRSCCSPTRAGSGQLLSASAGAAVSRWYEMAGPGPAQRGLAAFWGAARPVPHAVPTCNQWHRMRLNSPWNGKKKKECCTLLVPDLCLVQRQIYLELFSHQEILTLTLV